jgi:thioredoxin 1
MAERINADNFDSKALQSGKLVLIDFYSDSCIPCKMMSPVLAELEEQFGEKLYIGKVNIAYEEELVSRFGILSAPTLLLFKDGELIWKQTGAKKKAELQQLIEAELKGER